MTKKHFLLGVLLIIGNHFYGYDFEGNNIPETVTGKGLSLSTAHFKDGKQSLKWEWGNSETILTINDASIKNIVSSFDNRSGIKFWIYNETPFNRPLVFNFKDEQGRVQYTFDFNMNFKGWRAGWLAYSDMWTPAGGDTEKKYVATLEITAPQNVATGSIWIDRLEFVTSVDKQATPDAQIPENNRHLGRNIWHWGLLQQWEQTDYDIEIPASVSSSESAEMKTISDKIKTELKGKILSSSEISTLSTLVNSTFRLTSDGKGAPLMQKDNARSGDAKFADLNKLLNLSSRGWYMNQNTEYKNVFLNAVRYMLDQGFAYGSCMGTNHHYGYDTREIYGAIWWMKNELKEAGLWDDAYKAISYWSGLQETRLPYSKTRDEITDSWNTLILPRLACVMMIDNDNERLRALRSLSRWVNGSLSFTPGTIGGIKIDGTAFHHGGHYPGYSVPGYAYLGKYLSCVNNTSFGLDEDAFAVFKFALESARNQSNLRDWGLGSCGRNPFNETISTAAINTYAFLAKACDPIDKDLAADFLRLKEGTKVYTSDKNLANEFKQQGVTAAKAPQGFFTYNYACQGIFRYNDLMVSLKGFNYNLWGSEIYYQNNRFGRYQSYGSIQIIGTKSPKAIEGGYPVTESDSRYVEAGWDWNRMPGTTTIHLPWNLLNSPLTGDDMVRQSETFSGASSLSGKYGLFATKLSEFNRKNYTPSFKARKSAFCVGNRIICLGTGIENENENYPTETTLFQQSLNSPDETLLINNESISDFPIDRTEGIDKSTILKDITGNYYYIPKGQEIKILKSLQTSKENMKQGDTQGNYSTAYLNHGYSPQNGTYEYMIVLEPSNDDILTLNNEDPEYIVIQKDKNAHIVKDLKTNVTAYACLEPVSSTNDDYLLNSDKELMIMLQPHSKGITMSVCDPYINQSTYKYTNPEESRPITKNITLKGYWKLESPKNNVITNIENENTIITVTCQHGQPVEFSLSSNSTNIDSEKITSVSIYKNEKEIVIEGEAGSVYAYDTNGINLFNFDKAAGNFKYPIKEYRGIIIIKFITQQGKIAKKFIIS